MKRDELKDLGLDEKQVEAVMKTHGQDIQNVKDGFKDFESIKATNESLTAQMKERDEDLSGLKEKLKGKEGLDEQLATLQTKYDNDTQALNDSLASLKLNTSIDNALNQANARNTTAVKALLKMDDIKFTDDGKLDGLDAQLKQVKTDNAFLFDEGSHANYNPSGNGGKADTDDVEAFGNAWGFKKNTSDNK